ncbi:MAG: hypothetical protein IKR48_13410 [Kiritimatiellae bacterium]|nr:hypothetical protein [Kiritimatiellia bacterium]
MKIPVYLTILAIVAVCGCSDKKEVTFASLPDDAVIVKVNDDVLTKRDIVRFIQIEQGYARKLKGAERSRFEQAIEKDFFNFVPKYINQRLLVQDAKRCKVLTPEEAKKRMDALLDIVAKSRKTTREKLLADDSEDGWFVREAVEKRVWIDAHAASNIPPAVVVTPQMATNYLNLIEEETAAARSTNEAIRARLEGIRADCLAGKASFTNIAVQIGCADWDLGEKEGMEFDTASMRDAVFALKEGMISPVLESEEDLFLLYVAKVIPAEKNKDGKTVHPERRHAYQLALAKQDYPVKLTYEQAFKDLSYQLQAQAVKNFVDDLKTNGVNVIEWPNGTNLFKRIPPRR